MLKSMRNNVKTLSWTLWLVIFAFIGFIFVQWGSGGFEGENLDRDVAAVGRYAISGEEFQKNLAQNLEMYNKQFKNNLSRQAIQQLGIAEQVLQGMISGRIVQGEAARLKLTVSDGELQEAIRSHSAFQRDGRFIGAEEYERLLAYNHMSVLDFEDSLRKDLLADKLKQLVTAGQVLDADTLRQDYRKENDKAELDYIALRIDEIKEEPAVSEAELLAFHAKNPALFQSAEKRSGDVLALKFADFKKELRLKEEDLFAYYQQNKAMFKVAGKIKVSRIWLAYDAPTREDVLKRMDEVAAGLTPGGFAAKAMEISADEKAKDGGDWGYWGWQSFSPQEKTMIDNLSAGAISSPVDAGQGFSLLYVSEKVPETQEPYDAVKARIRSVLENEELKKLAGEKIAQAHAAVKKAGSLKAGAGKLVAKVVDSGLLTQGQAIKDIDEMGYISQKLFALGENEVSEPLEFPEGVGVVQLTRVVKPQAESFAVARDRVEKEVRDAKKLELLTARAAMVAAELNRLADAKKVEDYLKAESLKVESATYQRGNRLGDLPATPGLDDAVFAMAENSYSQPLAMKSAVAIVKLKSKKTVTDADFAREREGYTRRRLDEARNTRFGSFLMSKKDDYKIRFNAEIFEKIKESATNRFR
jgi:peptidyl-prolyl cis-trans isomerase D